MKIERLLGIVVLLLNRKRITAKELADKYEVNVRTIYRDMETINAAGIPIISYTGMYGGWGIMENYRLDKQVLSLDDMNSLIVTLRGVNKSLENKNIESVIEKMLSLIPNDRNIELKNKSDEFAVDMTPWGPVKNFDKENVKIIQKAIESRNVINFYYDNLKGEITNRNVEPMTIIFKGYSWYLFAYCRMREDFRIFKINRIQDLKITNEMYSRKEANYNDYLNNGSDKTNIIDLELKFTSQIFSRVQEYFKDYIEEIQEDSSTIVKLSIPSEEWIYSMIMGFGEHVEVLYPLEIREEVKKRLKKTLDVYNYDIVLSQ